jgi:hypothetical protein
MKGFCTSISNAVTGAATIGFDALRTGPRLQVPPIASLNCRSTTLTERSNHLSEHPGRKMSGYRVCGIRIGPVAKLETNFETPTNQVVQAAAPAADGICIHLLRLGGSGWKSMASLTKYADREIH